MKITPNQRKYPVPFVRCEQNPSEATDSDRNYSDIS